MSAEARLRLSPLFDAGFYRAQAEARGLALGDADPVAHYVAQGEAAGAAPHLLFDPGFYAARNPDVVAAGINLLAHYLDYGACEGRDPHPLVDLKLLRSQLGADFDGDPLIAYQQSKGARWKPHRLIDPAFLAAQQPPDDARPTLVFYLESDPAQINPSADFDGRSYLALYPQAAGWNPLVHYARFGEAEGLKPTSELGPALKAAALIEAAARLDPDLLKSGEDLAAVPVLRGYDLARREFRLYRVLTQAAGRRAQPHVILTPWLKRGGADRAVLHLARGLLEGDPEARVLIVCTQEDGVEALDWAPLSRRLCVAKAASEIDESHDTCAAFCNFLRLHGCQHLYVVNSRFGWELIVNYGAALKPAIRLYGFAFCQDYDEQGRRAGYAWTHLREAIDQLDSVVSDNGRTFDEFAADHGFDAHDAAKLRVLPLPVDERLRGRASPAAWALTRRRVFWAGRFVAQKALDVAVEVARALPEIDVCAFGGTEAPAGSPENFLVGGDFEDFADLPLHEAALFLHTARWEGLPNVLLEAGAAGLPILARDVGGVGELVDAETGWLLPRDAGPEDFAGAIREALAQPEAARARARRMGERIAARHSEAAFAAALRRLLGESA